MGFGLDDLLFNEDGLLVWGSGLRVCNIPQVKYTNNAYIGPVNMA